MTPFDHCHVPLSLSVFELRGHRTRVMRQATLVPGIYASCPVPLLFQPGTINGKLYADGGIADRGAVFGLRPGERTLSHHLQSRSPWRRRGSPAQLVPKRDGLCALTIDRLPRVGPQRLAFGPSAYPRAREATLAARDGPQAAHITAPAQNRSQMLAAFSAPIPAPGCPVAR